MLRSLIALTFGALAAFTTVTAAMADQDKAGEFDYYVLALSWSPNWCALEGDARNSPQCHPRHDHGWTVHGLWPQYHRGWPDFCPTNEPFPTRRLQEDMTDIMGTTGLVKHQWRKHGVCSGLSASAYFELTREAYETITRPDLLRRLTKPVEVPASVIEEAFLKENPQLDADGLTITCKSGHIQEARICLSKDLTPVPCGRDVIKDCTLKDALFTPIR